MNSIAQYEIWQMTLEEVLMAGISNNNKLTEQNI